MACCLLEDGIDVGSLWVFYVVSPEEFLGESFQLSDGGGIHALPCAQTCWNIHFRAGMTEEGGPLYSVTQAIGDVYPSVLVRLFVRHIQVMTISMLMCICFHGAVLFVLIWRVLPWAERLTCIFLEQMFFPQTAIRSLCTTWSGLC